jgi:hypothetical protein
LDPVNSKQERNLKNEAQEGTNLQKCSS